MLKKITKIVKGVCIFIFGVFATLASSVLLTFGCMKIYDIFWNPSNISAHLGGDAAFAIGVSMAIMFAMIVCVYHCDSVLKEIEEDEELERTEA